MSKYFFLNRLWLLCLTFAARALSLELPVGTWVDLTHEFSEQTIYWPTEESFKKTVVFAGQTNRGYFYSAYNYQAAEHGGTHMDAPIHFYRLGKTVEQIPVNQLIGEAMVVDVSRKSNENRDYQATSGDILEWEKHHGRLPESCIVLFRTGFSRYWPERKKYMGTAKLGKAGIEELSFPGVHPDTAGFLTKERNIKAVGLDTPSIDYGKSLRFTSHQIFSKHNIPVFENVANLELLPATGSFIVALPMKIKEGSGAPLRIVAFVPGSTPD